MTVQWHSDVLMAYQSSLQHVSSGQPFPGNLAWSERPHLCNLAGSAVLSSQSQINQSQGLPSSIQISAVKRNGHLTVHSIQLQDTNATQLTSEADGELIGVLLKKSSIFWASSSIWIVRNFSSNVFQVGSEAPLPASHASNIAFDPSIGLFSVLSSLTVKKSKCRASAILRNLGASCLQMEMPAISFKRSSALMVM